MGDRRERDLKTVMLSVMINLTSCENLKSTNQRNNDNNKLKKATQYKNNQKMRKQTFKKSNNTKLTKSSFRSARSKFCNARNNNFLLFFFHIS